MMTGAKGEVGENADLGVGIVTGANPGNACFTVHGVPVTRDRR
jgi:hypothetical protein